MKKTVRKPKRVARPWTREEIKFLRKWYRKQPTWWLMQQLHRTRYAIRYKASDLNIRKAKCSVWDSIESLRARGGVKFSRKYV